MLEMLSTGLMNRLMALSLPPAFYIALPFSVIENASDVCADRVPVTQQCTLPCTPMVV
jgi:hypothetical protein